MNDQTKKIAYFHLPGLFEFYEFYKAFLAIYDTHPEYFYDWCKISSIYGSPEDCIWSGGRIEYSQVSPKKVLELTQKYNISARLTFSNSLLKKEHLNDLRCNELCKLFNHFPHNGIIVHSDLLLNHLKETYPQLYFVSSTTKVITDFKEFIQELNRKEFKYVVPDFRLNKSFAQLQKLTPKQKGKVEFLCNECCNIHCKERKKCYETVSKQNLDESVEDHICPYTNEGYRFSKAMENPSFIRLEDIQNIYLPMGFSNFKIEGRSLGSALILEFLLYYLVKPKYHIHIREALYLDNTLDLF